MLQIKYHSTCVGRYFTIMCFHPTINPLNDTIAFNSPNLQYSSQASIACKHYHKFRYIYKLEEGVKGHKYYILVKKYEYYMHITFMMCKNK